MTQKLFLPIVSIFLASCFLHLQANAQVGCCRKPDSLRITSISNTQFCVSWKIKDSFPCDTVRSSVIQYRQIGSPAWITRTVIRNTWQNWISFCDSLQTCKRYEWQVKNNCDSGRTSLFVSGPTIVAPCDTTSCCARPDSLKFDGMFGKRFCVSWKRKDSLPCDSSVGATFRYRRLGSTSWKTVNITYTAGTNKYTYCDTGMICIQYEWQVRTKCSKNNIVTYSNWFNGPVFTFGNCYDKPAVRSNLNSNAQLTVKPNPAKNWLTVSISGLSNSKYILQIFDNNGKLVLTQANNMIGHNKSRTVDISSLNIGLYYLILRNEKETLKTNFIKE
jgi:hypothetical protein